MGPSGYQGVTLVPPPARAGQTTTASSPAPPSEATPNPGFYAPNWQGSNPQAAPPLTLPAGSVLPGAAGLGPTQPNTRVAPPPPWARTRTPSNSLLTERERVN